MANAAGGRAGSSLTGGKDAGAGQSGEAGAGGASEAGAPGNAGAGTGGEAGTPAEPLPDTQPPYVVEVSPPDGALGVRADAEVVVTFSEPMHRVETEKAYGSLDLPTKDVTFLWSDGDRKLTIHPDDGLEYGIPETGAGEPEARTYGYRIASEARDVAGNRLEEDFTASFTTLRKYTRTLPLNSARLITRSEVGEDGLLAACGEDEASAIIGEHVSGGGKLPFVLEGRGLLLAFELLKGRPATADDVLAAQLSFESILEQTALGPLLIDRVLPADGDPRKATWDMPVAEALASTNLAGTRTADVRAGLSQSWFEGDTRLHLFIHYDLMMTDDETTQSSAIRCGDTTRVVVTYLAR